MELIIRPTSTILLLLLLLSIPYFSTAAAARSLEVLENDVYEIDYRGPETHSSIPPPGHSHGHRHWMHRETDHVLPPHKSSSKGLRTAAAFGNHHRGRNAKKIHG